MERDLTGINLLVVLDLGIVALKQLRDELCQGVVVLLSDIGLDAVIEIAGRPLACDGLCHKAVRTHIGRDLNDAALESRIAGLRVDNFDLGSERNDAAVSRVVRIEDR